MKRLHRRALSLAVVPFCIPGISAAQESAAIFDKPVVVWGETSRVTNLADLDGDGAVDAIGTWNGTSGTLAVSAWRNDGAGAFSPIWTLNLPILNGADVGTARLATADFDLDGDDDFVVTASGILHYYLSNGQAVPTLWATVNEAGTVQEIVAADFDGDGRSDVAYVTVPAPAASLKVSLVGPGGPTTPVSTGLPGGAVHRLFVAQVEADGLPDLGVSSTSYPLGTEIRLFPVSGATPGTPLLFSMPGTYGAMPAAGDIDGDGDSDAVVFTTSGTYWVARRTGIAAFSWEGPYAGGPATDLADVDGDGDLDGVCCSGGGGGSIPPNVGASVFEVALNEGGTFAPSFSIRGLGAARIAGAVDVDGDGDTDLVAGRCVYYADGPIAGPPAPATGGAAPEDPMVADGDRDGDPDLFFGLGSQLRNAGDGSFSTAPPLAPAPPAGTTFVGPGWTGDFDGDGDVDVVVEHRQGPAVFLGMRLLRNTGGGGLVDGGAAAAAGQDMKSLPGGLTASIGPVGALAADADGDGDLDLVVRAWSASCASRIWWNDGTGFFAAGPEIAGAYVKHVANLDANPAPDLLAIAAQLGSGQVWLHRGLGGGAFAFPVNTPGFLSVNTGDRLAVADLDGDGDLDIAGVSGLAPTIRANDGNGNFSTALALPPTIATSTPRRVFVEDVDGDGTLDLLVHPTWGTSNGGTSIYLGTGAPFVFQTPIVQIVAPAVLSDLDGDGDLDGIGERRFRNRTFSGPAAGLRRQYGAGLAGTGGMVPTAGGVGPFRTGIPCETRLTGALGGSVGIYAFGDQPASLPIVGGTLLTNAQYLFPVSLGGTPGAAGEGSATIPWIAPPWLAGYSFYKQFGVLDPGALQWISLSNGLLVTIGQ